MSVVDSDVQLVAQNSMDREIIEVPQISIYKQKFWHGKSQCQQNLLLFFSTKVTWYLAHEHTTMLATRKKSTLGDYSSVPFLPISFLDIAEKVVDVIMQF